MNKMKDHYEDLRRRAEFEWSCTSPEYKSTHDKDTYVDAWIEGYTYKTQEVHHDQ